MARGVGAAAAAAAEGTCRIRAAGRAGGGGRPAGWPAGRDTSVVLQVGACTSRRPVDRSAGDWFSSATPSCHANAREENIIYVYNTYARGGPLANKTEHGRRKKVL